MTLVMLSVEGQTEEVLVNEVLQPHLQRFGVWLQPVIVATKRAAGRPVDKGGLTSWAKAERDIRRLLGNSAASLVTTMYDLYAFPPDAPGMAASGSANAEQRVADVESAIAAAIDHPRFLPYLSLFEVEALVLAARAELRAQGSGADFSRLDGLPPPEQVNDTDPPSHRIRACWKAYAKPVDGPAIVANAGLDAVRAECPHFDQWLTQLESPSRGGAP